MESKRAKRISQIVTLFFFVYLIVLLRITVFRSDFSVNGLFQNGSVNVSLFQGYIAFIRQGEWFAFTYLFLGNIIWFLPFGMYLQYRGKIKNIWYGFVYGFLFSLMIETLQYVFGTGFSELDDLVLNSLGAGLGAILVRSVQRTSEKKKMLHL